MTESNFQENEPTAEDTMHSGKRVIRKSIYSHLRCGRWGILLLLLLCGGNSSSAAFVAHPPVSSIAIRSRGSDVASSDVAAAKVGSSDNSPLRMVKNDPEIILEPQQQEVAPEPAQKKKNKIISSFKQLGKKKKDPDEEQLPDLSDPSRNKNKLISNLKEIYKESVLPIERKFQLDSFCLPTNGEIQDAEFDARPMVLLMGQYSTGKTTFIRHLLGGKDFPGMHIGPEPTTDTFMALIHGEDDNNKKGKSSDSAKNSRGDADVNDDANSLNATTSIKASVKGKIMSGDDASFGKIIKGNSLTVTPELPFSSLSQFGAGFLNSFVGSIMDAPLLRSVTLIDTPGILSGEKQKLNRSYDFAQTAKWFADRSDLILLLFDADKLDVSDELKEVVTTIRLHNNDKIRCVLNKADGVSREQLVRVYGSLMWSMGKLFTSPEVIRVYTGSFWDEPLVHDDFKDMFRADESLLVRELTNLPTSNAERKVNQMVKRIRLVKVHVCILDHLRRKMRRAIRKQKTRRRLISNLDQVFDEVQHRFDLPRGDMPDAGEFAACLEEMEDFSVFPKVNRKLLRKLDELILQTIPAIMQGSVGVTNEII